jgi:pimeloyl-ACP methyl ester carboxylesterase
VTHPAEQQVEHPLEQPVEAPVGAPVDAPVQRMVRPHAGGPRLAVREFPGHGRPFLLVHGLASNARLWDGVARNLAAAGHRVVAVDLRGHGLSEAPEAGYDTDSAADDLAGLAAALGLRGPVVAGQSWGGNVVLSLAARHSAVAAAVACLDGGWLRPREWYASFDECWSVLAPPVLDGVRYSDVARRIRTAHPDWPADGIDATLGNLVELPGGGVRARLAREHHREILRSMYEQDPADWYPRVTVPVLLVPAVGEEAVGEKAVGEGAVGEGAVGEAAVGEAAVGEQSRSAREAVREALAALPDARARWYPGADHDLHAQHPDRLAADLEDLAHRLDEHPLDEHPVDEHGLEEER